jgi:hypothetical protein
MTTETNTNNAKLQQKKNALRKELAEKGILKREGKNSFDKYSYFSEAQYKELFTYLFSKYGLELSASAVGYKEYEGTDKQSFGRIVDVQFILTDIETGCAEVSHMFGEGMDKGDKGGYKAYTGALKYYLASTFMVATGDDPEAESPSPKRKPEPNKDDLIRQIKEKVEERRWPKMFETYKVNGFEELTIKQAEDILRRV